MAVQAAVVASGGERNAAAAAVLGEGVAGLLPAAALVCGWNGCRCWWNREELRLGLGGGAGSRE